MSIVRSYSVFCDVKGPSCIGRVVQTVDGAPAARKEAKALGWKRITKRSTAGKHPAADICPPCQFTKPMCSECGARMYYYGTHGWLHTGPLSCTNRDRTVTPIEGT